MQTSRILTVCMLAACACSRAEVPPPPSSGPEPVDPGHEYAGTLAALSRRYAQDTAGLARNSIVKPGAVSDLLVRLAIVRMCRTHRANPFSTDRVPDDDTAFRSRMPEDRRVMASVDHLYCGVATLADGAWLDFSFEQNRWVPR